MIITVTTRLGDLVECTPDQIVRISDPTEAQRWRGVGADILHIAGGWLEVRDHAAELYNRLEEARNAH